MSGSNRTLASSPVMKDADEIYDVVDANDKVIGRATRRQIHASSLLHRSVHILVFNPEGKLFLQKRAPTKDENPGMLDTSAAGHVDSGEDYLACAHRELYEELGIRAEIQPFMKIKASRETAWEHVEVFQCVSAQKMRINEEEISEGRFWSLEEINNAIQNNDLYFTSTFKVIIRSYIAEK